MKFNRGRFFSKFREEFGALKQEQVDGLNSLLHNFETYWGWWDDLDQIANALAQIKHETAHSFQPVCEAYYLGDPSKPNYYQGNTDRVKRVQQGFRYFPYFGMGYIQLTWEENFRKLDALIRKYFPELVQQVELRTGEKFDLVKNPDQALDPDVSFAIMTIGMHKGSFRAGQTLDRYINAAEIDHFGAREIVNGDKNYRMKGTNTTIGRHLESDAKRFTKILKWSLAAEGAALPETETELATAFDDSTPVPPAVENTTFQEPLSDPQQSPESLPTQNAGQAEGGFVTETVTVDAPPPTGFIGKLKAQGIALFAGIGGLAGLKEWFQVQISPETLSLLTVAIPTVLGLGFLGLIVWYVSEKVIGFKTLKMQAMYAADPDSMAVNIRPMVKRPKAGAWRNVEYGDPNKPPSVVP